MPRLVHSLPLMGNTIFDQLVIHSNINTLMDLILCSPSSLPPKKSQTQKLINKPKPKIVNQTKTTTNPTKWKNTTTTTKTQENLKILRIEVETVKNSFSGFEERECLFRLDNEKFSIG